MIEANAGFHGEMSMEKGVNETFEQELTWTVDNEIEVPSGHVTTAELVIKVCNCKVIPLLYCKIRKNYLCIHLTHEA